MPRRIVLALFFAVAAVRSDAADDDLPGVLRRAGEYVTAFRRELSGIVAEESYAQDVRTQMGVTIMLDGRGTAMQSHRDIRSDIVMVRTDEGYVEFRDVFEVDGRPVRDRENRLAKLFLQDSVDAREQIIEIEQESSRYNIGNVYRNFNTPALALMFLEPELQGRFKFRRAASKPPSLVSGWKRGVASRFDLPASAWVVEYQETQKGTLIRRAVGNGDLPARGRFWIDPASGRVLASELEVGDPLARATIVVAYAHEPVAVSLIPVEMRERYVNGTSRVVTEGTAEYGRLRRFGVAVDEDIPPVGPPDGSPPPADSPAAPPQPR